MLVIILFYMRAYHLLYYLPSRFFDMYKIYAFVCMLFALMAKEAATAAIGNMVRSHGFFVVNHVNEEIMKQASDDYVKNYKIAQVVPRSQVCGDGAHLELGAYADFPNVGEAEKS